MPASLYTPAPSAQRTVLALAALLLLGGLAACGGGGKDGPAAASAATAASAAAKAPVELLVSPEDILTVGQAGAAGRGALITGAIVPEKRADVRAELGAVVQQVLKENGDTVQRGDVLVKLDESTVRDSLNAAEESLRAATLSFEQSERQLQRVKSLQAQGMVSQQAAEDAEVRRNNANSDVLAAKARVVNARQQLQRTEVRAPFDGVVVERKVSVGDTVQVGRELLKVMDPRTLRLEGRISADQLREVRVGQSVRFSLNGYGAQRFEGRVQRVDAVANASTRQVEVVVALVGEAPTVAGLFAEGEVLTQAEAAQGKLVLPQGAVQPLEGKQMVWRLGADNKLQRVEVTLGELDPRHGWWPVKTGVQAGDRLLRNPTASLSPGQPFRLGGAGAAVVSAPASGAKAGAQAASAASAQ
ncbi:efflux RND transporter periplasmic adaptor subunit [Ideonella paludis]|uniref:Efflux RND transporter periplasmic adaptor subunit n=1 Tax=Ideonella paludis TaxID=1233411 RepID=A0ABS5E2W6_9BURK|nr:efflux RND transporter periplasmic adaptor subunit [Ideonella paludis]MBQ0937356.1 efflux RND transporter periplasmic adaptor subunit [Ideonella paludis]